MKKYNKIFARKPLNNWDYFILTVFSLIFATYFLNGYILMGIASLLFAVSYFYTIYREKGFKVEINTNLTERDLWLIKDGESETYCLAATEYEVVLLTDKLLSPLSESAEIINKGKVLIFE